MDLSNLTLLIYKKGVNDPAFTGQKGSGQATITGLPASTVVADGDYQSAFTDGTDTSGRTDVPGFTVLASTDNIVGNTIVGQAKL